MNKGVLKTNADLEQEAEMYKALYLKLFNRVTDALTALDEKDDKSGASYILKRAQMECEEIYIAV